MNTFMDLPEEAKPFVSVLMSVYNAENYLGSSVESILAQTYGNFEFVIVDDGSTDGSATLLRQYAHQDARIRLTHQQNQGLAKTLNVGIEKARGEFIARMDADDIAFPERLEQQVSFLEAHPNSVLVGAQVQLIDEAGDAIQEGMRYERLKELPREHKAIDRALLQQEWPLVHPAVTMRAKSVKAVGGYDERHEKRQDHDLFLRLAEVGRLSNMAEILLKYRQHPTQVTKIDEGSYPLFHLRYIVRDAYRRRGKALPKPLKFLPVRQLLRKMPPQIERGLLALKKTLVG